MKTEGEGAGAPDKIKKFLVPGSIVRLDPEGGKGVEDKTVLLVVLSVGEQRKEGDQIKFLAHELAGDKIIERHATIGRGLIAETPEETTCTVWGHDWSNPEIKIISPEGKTLTIGTLTQWRRVDEIADGWSGWVQTSSSPSTCRCTLKVAADGGVCVYCSFRVVGVV